MSTLEPTATPEDVTREMEETTEKKPRGGKRSRTGHAASSLSSPWASLTAVVIAVLWTLPTIGLLVTSFRGQRDIQRSGWWTFWQNPGGLTLDNYRQALAPGSSAGLSQYFVNTVVITLPAVVLPIFLASLAAYAFAWMPFPGRDALFVAVFALQIVPIQIALVPLLDIYVNKLGFGASYWSVWLSHTIFALPLATFLIHNFMRELPGELMEAARVDGAGHVTIFFRILLPLLTPALAAFGIFQFLWVWNDLLVSLVFLGGTPDVAPITVRVAELSGSRGSAWYLLSAGAFISMVVPVAVFLALQRFFVRGLLAGGLKG
ncbi:carbohydrate ABC transporter permease [Phycicoccus sp. CSK15P-2]|uniref:carbohydrate ABC transporter permease n=1 Tax=Phycicoccus sp. CSK15P-2 TaxID=2807627 RepID=UPI00194F3BD9|nr:carbohydrate ABC transporter permease [Phycicoccus sp. CSK15P-2]MBM6404005.1 carbohydrate ABC transporter permease [Phycicoccus sp. CSK15P-2]